MAKSQQFRQDPWGDDSIEKLRPSGNPKMDWQDQVKGLVNPNNFLDQLFGANGASQEHGRPLSKEKPVQKRQETLIFSSETRRQEIQLQQETNAILQQLKEQVKLLEKSEKSLTLEISKVTIEQSRTRKGIYFLRYLEWLLTEVRKLRIKVEEGRTWLAEFTQRKKKKLGYWQKFKKQGTTFGLSNERVVATQTG